MLIISPKYDKGIDQLGAYLEALVGQDKLALAEGGAYKRRPAPAAAAPH